MNARGSKIGSAMEFRQEHSRQGGVLRVGESPMNKFEGSTFESLLEETGELEEVRARATKQVLAILAERRMRELGLTMAGRRR